LIRIRRHPHAISRSMVCLRIGTPPRVNRGLGMVRVWGSSLVPNPAASINAFMICRQEAITRISRLMICL